MTTENYGAKIWPGSRPLKPGSHQIPADVTAKNLREYLGANDIRYVLAQFVDIHGVAKSKAVPTEHVEDLLVTGAGFAGGGVWGLGLQPHQAEYMVVCELDT